MFKIDRKKLLSLSLHVSDIAFYLSSLFLLHIKSKPNPSKVFIIPCLRGNPFLPSSFFFLYSNQTQASFLYPQKKVLFQTKFSTLVLSFMTTTSSYLVLFLFLSCFPISSVSDPRATEAALVCTNRTAAVPDRRTFINTFLSSLDALTPQISSQRFAKTIKTTGNITVYASGQCMNDLSQLDCNQCFAQCKTQILRCLPFQKAVRGGRDYFDGCYLRYDDYDFFQEPFSPGDKAVCSKIDFNGNSTVYRANAMELVRNLSVQAPKNDGFSVGSVERGNSTVYGLVQCWKSVNMTSCRLCLENATLVIGSCLPKEEGRVLNAGCYLRYSPHKFYYNSTTNNTGGGGGSHLVVILAVVCSVSAVIIILAPGAFFARRKISKKKKERKQLGALAATLRKSDLNYKYEVLEKATNYFSNPNKLGQGGSGSVYKGTLPGGKVIAVKRLVFTTRQWAEQFFNEVNLISDVNHKNLVKLLGCSITGPESLLVYEYIPNQSVQDHLFNKDKSRILSWEVRYNIIAGTAEGLVYLHEESNMRIIHRDIKLTNVLLDENFMAKIADFGLARLFPEDKTHISTGIAGTLGYMAPEYVVHGKLTEKADVYSFGVLVIEVVSGRRNNSFTQDSGSILQMVWSYYVSGRLIEAVDARLDGSFQNEEASRVLQIGLLCTQASAELRPSMSMVVKMLTGDHDIPQPTQPPFLNTSSVSAGSSLLSPETRHESDTKSSRNTMTESWLEPR